MKPEAMELLKQSVEVMEKLEIEVHALSGAIVRLVLDEVDRNKRGATNGEIATTPPVATPRKRRAPATQPLDYAWVAVGPNNEPMFIHAPTRAIAEKSAKAVGASLAKENADALEAMIARKAGAVVV